MTTPRQNNIETRRDETNNEWNSHPTSIIMIEKPFSLFVFGLEILKRFRNEENDLELLSNLTFPKPTDVNEEKVKYKAVIYLEVFVGPDVGSESL